MAFGNSTNTLKIYKRRQYFNICRNDTVPINILGQYKSRSVDDLKHYNNELIPVNQQYNPNQINFFFSKIWTFYVSCIVYRLIYFTSVYLFGTCLGCKKFHLVDQLSFFKLKQKLRSNKKWGNDRLRTTARSFYLIRRRLTTLLPQVN